MRVKLQREEKRQRGRKGLVRRHAGRNQKEKHQAAQKKKGDAKRRRRTRADRAKRRMCERRVRHRESQLFPITFSHGWSSAGFPCCCSRIGLNIHHICLTLTLFDGLCLHMSEVMKVLQGKAAPVSSGSSNGICASFIGAKSGLHMRILGTRADKLKLTGTERLLGAARHRTARYPPSSLQFVRVPSYPAVCIIMGNVPA